MRPGLNALYDQPILPPRWLDGLGDTLGILEESAGAPVPAPLTQFRQQFDAANALRPTTLLATWCLLEQLSHAAETMREHLEQEPESQACWWLRALTQHCRTDRDELVVLAPWLELPPPPDGLVPPPDLDAIPTQRALAGLVSAPLTGSPGDTPDRFRETVYHITVTQLGADAEGGLTVDGIAQASNVIALLADHLEHTVALRIPVA